MSDFFDRLEGELRQAVRRGAVGNQARGWRGWRASAGWAPIAAGAAVVVAVVIVIAAVGTVHRGGGGLSTIPSGARGLMARFAVLRRPQTAADRAYPTSLLAPLTGRDLRGLHLTIVPSLIRVAPAPRGVRVVLFVARTTSDRPLVGSRITRSALGYHLEAIAFVSARGRARGALMGGLPSTINGIEVGVVPDGIARVRWTFRRESTAAAGTASQPPSVSAKVHENVAAAPALRVGPPTSATWYDARNRVVASVKGVGPPFGSATFRVR